MPHRSKISDFSMYIRKIYLYTVSSRLSTNFLQRRYNMPSLSRFSFWSCLVGFVLFVHSASPIKFFSMPEGSETAVFFLALVLTLIGSLGYIVSSAMQSAERTNSENIESIWRHFDSRDVECNTRFDRINDRMIEIESRKSSR